MSLSKVDIAGMLYEYENDFHTGMDTDEIAGLFYDHTAVTLILYHESVN